MRDAFSVRIEFKFVLDIGIRAEKRYRNGTRSMEAYKLSFLIGIAVSVADGSRSFANGFLIAFLMFEINGFKSAGGLVVFAELHTVTADYINGEFPELMKDPVAHPRSDHKNFILFSHFVSNARCSSDTGVRCCVIVPSRSKAAIFSFLYPYLSLRFIFAIEECGKRSCVAEFHIGNIDVLHFNALDKTKSKGISRGKTVTVIFRIFIVYRRRCGTGGFSCSAHNFNVPIFYCKVVYALIIRLTDYHCFIYRKRVTVSSRRAEIEVRKGYSVYFARSYLGHILRQAVSLARDHICGRRRVGYVKAQEKHIGYFRPVNRFKRYAATVYVLYKAIGKACVLRQ